MPYVLWGVRLDFEIHTLYRSSYRTIGVNTSPHPAHIGHRSFVKVSAVFSFLVHVLRSIKSCSCHLGWEQPETYPTSGRELESLILAKYSARNLSLSRKPSDSNTRRTKPSDLLRLSGVGGGTNELRRRPLFSFVKQTKHHQTTFEAKMTKGRSL